VAGFFREKKRRGLVHGAVRLEGGEDGSADAVLAVSGAGRLELARVCTVDAAPAGAPADGANDDIGSTPEHASFSSQPACATAADPAACLAVCSLALRANNGWFLRYLMECYKNTLRDGTALALVSHVVVQRVIGIGVAKQQLE
jgi:hypothetical protein